MFRKSFVDKFNLRYDPDYTACEDHELWSRASRYGKIANLPDVLLKYRWHGGNASVLQKQTQAANTRRVQKNLMDFLWGSDDESKKRFCLYFGFGGARAVIWLLWFIPLLTIRAKQSGKKIYLFGFIPLVKIKRGKILLFHLIPIAKIGKIAQN